MADDQEFIELYGAATNNLKHINLKIPKYKINLFTGVSGSGKSSLVFSTIAAESQRMVNKTYSSYVQQMLPQYPEPIIENIKNLPFSIVVDQKPMTGNSRSTVGTYTDIYTGLRLLFSRLAQPFIGYSMNYSFNNPVGMCPACQGLGKKRKIVIDRLIDWDSSLNDGAIHFPTFRPGEWRLTRYTESGYFDNDLPLKKWEKEKLDLFLYGQPQTPTAPTQKWHKTAKYIGLLLRIRETFLTKETKKYATEIANITETAVCSECHGTRVNKKVESAKIKGTSIADCSQMTLAELYDWLQSIDQQQVMVVVGDLKEKLRSLSSVGLDYLMLNRSTLSLSGGEAQRVRLANYLTSSLTNILYIFDEPSVGLHPHDLVGINRIFKNLCHKGNTVLIIDHDPDIIKIADQVFNLGEKAGTEGGYLTYHGSLAGLIESKTATGRELSKKPILCTEQRCFTEFYMLQNVSLHNIHNASIKVPKKALTVVTGVAGSGKSTLIRDLFVEKYPQTIVLSQRNIHTSSRSNVLTYLGIFDAIREKFARHTHKPVAFFSFNGKGACEICKGKGYVEVDLAYMGKTKYVCEACQGQRYNQEVLKQFWKGINIAQFLKMSVKDAAKLFNTGKLHKVLDSLMKVNLDYIKLGQTLDTFSGGELQRLKIAQLLINLHTNVIVLDEPTSGLHEADIQNLVNLFKTMIAAGYTIIILEHNLHIMGQADWIIDMGPLAGQAGGKVLFQGYVQQLMKNNNTLTAKSLNNYYGQ